jgi:hypothetical protein
MLVALWATLGTARRITPLCLLALVTVFASMWVARTDQLHRTAWWSALPREFYPTAYFFLVCAYAVAVYLSLTLLRTGGYRLGKL